MELCRRSMYPVRAVLQRQMCNISANNSSKLLFHTNALLSKTRKLETVTQKSITRSYGGEISSSAVQKIEEITVNKDGKPIAPDPETCCETGCVHCVWIKYVEELENYYPEGLREEEIQDILNQIHDPVVRSFVKMELGA